MSNSKKRPHDLLDILSENIAESAKKRKEVAVSSGDDVQTEEHALQTTATWISNIFSSDPSFDFETVELELRLGKKTDETFHPGINQIDFDTLCSKLGESGKFAIETSEKTVYLYDAPAHSEENPYDRGGSLRIDFDEANARCLSKELKVNVGNCSVQLGNLAYDLRTGISHEIQLPAPPSLPDGYACRRHKLRYSFHKAAENPQEASWVVDLTKVTTMTPIDDGTLRESVSYELEIELDDAPQYARSLLTQEGAMSALSGVWTLIQELLNMLESAALANFADLQLQEVRNEQELMDLRRKTAEWVPDWNDENRFPGPMPIAFSRRHMITIQTHAYMVSEKSDGLRYMLVINSSGAYLVDRLFSFHYVPGYDALIDLYASNDITILDGELVRHHVTKRPVFMIFDAVVINSLPVATNNLSERLEAIRDKIIVPFREAEKAGKLDTNKVPFTLIGKVFLNKKQIQLLFEKHIRRIDGVRYYIDNRRHHKTDGIIFTPVDDHYIPQRASILKWKYPDLVSIDFKMRYHHGLGKWLLCGNGNNGEDVDLADVELPDEDNARLARDMQRAPQTDDGSIVIELTYDMWIGSWRYHGVRSDKRNGNQMKTIFNTMEVIAENISQAELIHRIPIDPSRDDWKQRVTAALNGTQSRRAQHAQQQRQQQQHAQQQHQALRSSAESALLAQQAHQRQLQGRGIPAAAVVQSQE